MAGQRVQQPRLDDGDGELADTDADAQFGLLVEQPRVLGAEEQSAIARAGAFTKQGRQSVGVPALHHRRAFLRHPHHRVEHALTGAARPRQCSFAYAGEVDADQPFTGALLYPRGQHPDRGRGDLAWANVHLLQPTRISGSFCTRRRWSRRSRHRWAGTARTAYLLVRGTDHLSGRERFRPARRRRRLWCRQSPFRLRHRRS